VQIEPQNIQAWVARGLAYERLNDREKSAGSYAKALNIRRDHATAQQGFARVGGEYGKTYQTF
jgi:Tfp pilus assembly protein PilF